MEARASSIDALEAAGRLVARWDRDQEVPVSGAARTVEIILLREWYVRQTHVHERMRELIEDIEFHPPRNRQFLTDWRPTSRSIGPSPVDDGTILRSRSGMPTKAEPSSHRHEASTCSLGGTDPPRVASSSIDRREHRAGPGRSSRGRSVPPSVRSRSSIHGWIPRIQPLRERVGRRPESLRTRLPGGLHLRKRSFELGYYTLRNPHSFSIARFEHVWIDGLGMDPWGRKMSKPATALMLTASWNVCRG